MSLDTAKLGGPYATVFDVGAFRGDFAKACALVWPDARVECFEPLEPQPDQLEPGMRWHGVALGTRRGIEAIFRCEFVPSSSLLPMTDLHKTAFPYTQKNEVKPVALETLFEYRNLITPPALLKIDVQGYELEVLYGGAAVLPLFDAVALEVSHEELYEGAPSFENIDRFLRFAGLIHSARLDELRHPQTDALLQSDELWVR